MESEECMSGSDLDNFLDNVRGAKALRMKYFKAGESSNHYPETLIDLALLNDMSQHPIISMEAINVIHSLIKSQFALYKSATEIYCRNRCPKRNGKGEGNDKHGKDIQEKCSQFTLRIEPDGPDYHVLKLLTDCRDKMLHGYEVGNKNQIPFERDIFDIVLNSLTIFESLKKRYLIIPNYASVVPPKDYPFDKEPIIATISVLWMTVLFDEVESCIREYDQIAEEGGINEEGNRKPFDYFIKERPI